MRYLVAFMIALFLCGCVDNNKQSIKQKNTIEQPCHSKDICKVRAQHE